ncbi:MAG: hypothetical protein KFB95_03135 [Simkaniaceae bacterium]|nr:MAG: hypothetical protein KFB95_03135 [Simkaniaceae bacterium]
MNSIKDALQEKGRSPNSDIAGPLIGELSYRCISAITHYATSTDKPLNKYQQYAFPMVIIGGLGTSFLLATTMGKTWKHWGGNFALAAGASILGTLNRKHGNRWQCALLLSIALMSCKYALQQHRNPSLILKPYLIHGIANAVLCTANQKIYEKNLLGLSKDEDAKWIYFSVSTLCLSYLLAKGIQNKMGAKSLKINWKVESLTQGASLAVLLFAGSKRSPIYED